MSLFSRFDSITQLSSSFFFHKRYFVTRKISTFESIHPVDTSISNRYIPFQSRETHPPSPFDIPFPLYTHRESSMVSSNHFLPLYSTWSITNQFRGYSGIGSLPVPPCSTSRYTQTFSSVPCKVARNGLETISFHHRTGRFFK